MAIAVFNKKRTTFTRRLDLNLRKKIVRILKFRAGEGWRRSVRPIV
jgi:hypothetical protein